MRQLTLLRIAMMFTMKSAPLMQSDTGDLIFKSNQIISGSTGIVLCQCAFKLRRLMCRDDIQRRARCWNVKDQHKAHS